MHDDVMLIVGGYGEGILHTLAVDRWVWTSVHVHGPTPWQYALFGCAAVRHQLILFGGHEVRGTVDSEGYLMDDAVVRHSNALYALDLSKLPTATGGGSEADEGRPPSGEKVLTWHELRADGARPCERFCLELADAGGGNLIVFGGTDTDGAALNDTHILHISTPGDLMQAKLEWQAVEQPRPIKNGSRVRIAGLVSCPELNGTIGHAVDLDEAAGRWVVKFVDGEQIRVKPANLELLPTTAEAAPQPRNAMTMTGFGSRYLVFGGGIFAEKYYNDLWIFELQLEASLPPPPSFATTELRPYVASLVGSERFADVSFALPGGDAVPAHRVLLCSGGSAYLSALLEGGFREGSARGADGGPLVLTLPGDGWTKPTLLHVLRFLYTGEVPPAVREDADDSAALMEILIAADAIEIEPLRALCETKLAQAVDETQALEALLLADGMSLRNLKDFCLKFLQQSFGSLRRCALSLPPPPPISSLGGYERLGGPLLDVVHWAVYGRVGDG